MASTSGSKTDQLVQLLLVIISIISDQMKSIALGLNAVYAVALMYKDSIVVSFMDSEYLLSRTQFRYSKQVK